MSDKDKILGDFHQAGKPEKHKPGSIGNQQIWDAGKQVGSVEFTPDSDKESIDVELFVEKDKKITDL